VARLAEARFALGSIAPDRVFRLRSGTTGTVLTVDAGATA